MTVTSVARTAASGIASRTAKPPNRIAVAVTDPKLPERERRDDDADDDQRCEKDAACGLGHTLVVAREGLAKHG